MLLCSWDGVSNPLDSNGSGMPMEATSSAVWAPGKQSQVLPLLAQRSPSLRASAKRISHHSSRPWANNKPQQHLEAS